MVRRLKAVQDPAVEPGEGLGPLHHARAPLRPSRQGGFTARWKAIMPWNTVSALTSTKPEFAQQDRQLLGRVEEFQRIHEVLLGLTAAGPLPTISPVRPRQPRK
jgi:hypothetical protein